MYFADIASSPFYCGWNWRTGWAQISIAGSENEGKVEMQTPYFSREGRNAAKLIPRMRERSSVPSRQHLAHGFV
jgi:hypothetical protein